MSREPAHLLVDSLIPRPVTVRRRRDGLALRRRPRVVVAVESPAAARHEAALARALDGAGLATGGSGERVEIRISIAPSGHGRESYRLDIGPAGVEIVGGGEAGLFWGIQTLAQCLRLAPRAESIELPGLRIEDHPALAERGLLLDVSRNKVPTMATLFELVDRLAAFKLNQLQLYTEHTFAYSGHEAVWRGASPLTADEVRRLDRYCAERYVELVPNQNSFGHFHRWLIHPRYRPLAERPDGVEHPFSDAPEPFGLCPVDPGSIALLEDLYDELLPNFESPRFNVGLDETLDLGTGRSAEAARRRGVGGLYLDFLRHVHRLAAAHGRRIQFWADVVLDHPELIPQLPGDVTGLVWGYEAESRFEERCRPFADAGLSFCLCPGTSSWLSLAGRWDNALANLADATRAAVATGAAGVLITDWGDLGHLQPLAVSWLGYLAGADLAWRGGDEAPPRAWPELLDLHVFGASGLGRVARGLGNVYQATGAPIRNGTVLGRLVLSHRDRLDHPRYGELSAAGLADAANRVAELRQRLSGLSSPGDPPAAAELAWVGRAVAFAARLGAARLAAGREREIEELPGETRRDLARRLDRVIEELSPLWMTRNRTGGLADSRGRLEALAVRLRGGPA